ncbi:dual 3',5'-cyclic-AMP and -GMP phosphodiesterase 11-like [Fopius arisanus]|uniref:Dual 3',5'-cyclic-AMP and -GMP phosphodiesterase 11-like n=1 Tax=Fopius arisanus TaxID=64838 RepID=A0A9R1TQL5_9HYME|nr:PREDICTED: dual 3',5'-cyclic-AMP and -GMP phosphodiesterase 11-like [Fopius arisanus]XP_011313485.1 PREDICTED: dual 3',5'-cyclic-AMP and -GMP phosphodiesterase 11-like [Fopius arisanus]
MEHHHFDQCLMILSSEGNQILSNLSPEEYSRVVKVLEEAILATDLAVYFSKRGAFLSIARSRTYNWGYGEHRELLRGMLMTVCDLAAITKPWEIEKRVAELVSSEFFEQGDIERRTLNITPIVSFIFHFLMKSVNDILLDILVVFSSSIFGLIR